MKIAEKSNVVDPDLISKIYDLPSIWINRSVITSTDEVVRIAFLDEMESRSYHRGVFTLTRKHAMELAQLIIRNNAEMDEFLAKRGCDTST